MDRQQNKTEGDLMMERCRPLSTEEIQQEAFEDAEIDALFMTA
jgi:hypothetical protein